MTVWQATQKLSVDNLYSHGDHLNVIEMLVAGDDFLQFDAEIIDGDKILILGKLWNTDEV